MEATAAWRYITGYVLRIEEDSHIDAVRALWNYIKISCLQDEFGCHKIKADDYLLSRLRVVGLNHSESQIY